MSVGVNSTESMCPSEPNELLKYNRVIKPLRVEKCRLEDEPTLSRLRLLGSLMDGGRKLLTAERLGNILSLIAVDTYWL